METKILPQRKEIRLQGYDYSCQGNYFVTIVVQNRRCLFGSIVDGKWQPNAAGEAINQALAQIAQVHEEVSVPYCVVMPDHIHFIVSLPGNVSLSEVVRRFKSYTTHLYIEGVKHQGWPRFDKKLWQHNYYEHIIRNQHEYDNIANYIVTNPERWKLGDGDIHDGDIHDGENWDIHKVSPYKGWLIGIGIMIMMIALTSCGGGDEMALTGVVEPVEPPTEVGTVISFSAQESEEQEMSQGARGYTRAASPLSAIATQFTVWGHKDMGYDDVAGAYGDMQTVFPGYTVKWQDNSAATTTTNTNGWEYVQATPTVQTVKYWDWSSKAYRFFAVTGYTAHEPNGAYGPAGAYKAHEISIAADASDEDEMDDTPYFSRLWFSTGDPVTYADKQFGRPVTLEFVKPYARVRFIFKYVYPREGIALTEKCFKPTADYDVVPPATATGIARKGTFTVKYPLDGTEIKEWYETTPAAGGDGALEAFDEDYDPENDSTVYSSECPGGWYSVLPNLTQGSYKLSVSVNGETKYATVPEAYMRWQPGYSYTYVFKILDEGGVEIGWVESAVTPWTEMTGDWTVYNW